MKSLPEDQQYANWNSSILNDLSFIKRTLRYPIKRMTLMPLLSSGILVLFVSRLMYIGMFSSNTKTLFLLACILLGIPSFISLVRYWNILHFFEVKSPTTLAGNMSLLANFLKEKQLITFRHPEAPEIFQIISRNIATSGEEREVLIFIVEDHRFLINSHFTSSRSRFRLVIRATHHQSMIKELNQWLTQQSLTNITSLQQKF